MKFIAILVIWKDKSFAIRSIAIFLYKGWSSSASEDESDGDEGDEEEEEDEESSKLQLLFRVPSIDRSDVTNFPWVRTCLLQLLLVEKRLVQPSSEQPKGFSPVWDLICCLRALFWFQRLPQPLYSHTKGFSPVWIRVWIRRWAGRRKDFPHPGKTQGWGFFPWWCPLQWSTKFLLEVKSRLQSEKGQQKPVASRSQRSLEIPARSSRDIFKGI